MTDTRHVTLLLWVKTMKSECDVILWINADAVQRVQTDLFMFIRQPPEAEARLVSMSVSMHKSSTQGLYGVRLSPGLCLFKGRAEDGARGTQQMAAVGSAPSTLGLTRVLAASVCNTARAENIHYRSCDWPDRCVTLRDDGAFGR